MKTEARGLLMLLGTLALGVLLGAAGNGALQRERRERMEQIRRPNGFVEHMMEIIRPRDEAQRSAILPTVRATAERNRQVIEGAHRQLRAALDSMRAQLAPQLDAGQRARLDEFARMPPPPGGLPPRPGPGGRPPPPRWDRPPPPRYGPPPP